MLPNISFFHELADLADAETLPRYRTVLDIDTKFKPGYSFDPVTEADREAERIIRAAIGVAFPSHAILGEEFGESGEGPIKWVLDPVDGTRPFICGLPVWGTLIGLMQDNRAVMGMMSQPFTGERFWADESGAWLERGGEKQAMYTRSDATLADAIMHTTTPETWKGAAGDQFATLTSQVRMTRYGGECYAMAMLAAGRIDICVEPSLQPYDIVALIPIIEQAGGVITTVDGGRAEAGGMIVASANATLHEAVLKVMAKGV